MPWAIVWPTVVVLFDSLIFVVAMSITRYAAHEHDREWQQPGATAAEGATTPSAAFPGAIPSHAT